IIASDASENTKKKFIDKCQFYHVDYLILEDSTHLSNAIGKSNRMVFGITDRGFSNTLKDKVRRLTNG
ncbi:MAG: L7Ae/L30e/S12e/Gadd45 family ribosomal protein, partial [Sharpea porci]